MASKESYQRNKEKYAARGKVYRAKNKDKIRSRIKEWDKRTRITARGRLAKLIKAIKSRCPSSQLKVTDLIKLWELQEGRCALTGVTMATLGGDNQLNAVSVDKIFSKEGYVPSNVRLVTWQVNIAKSIGTDAQFYEMCEQALRRKNPPTAGGRPFEYEKELKTFTDAVAYKLYKNRHKGKWEDISIEEAVIRLKEEVVELEEAIGRNNAIETILEAADVGAWAMILANISIKLTQKATNV